MAIPIAVIIDFMLFKMGTENHILDLLNGINKNKFKPILIVFRCSSEMRTRIERIGVPVIELGIDKIYGIKEDSVILNLLHAYKLKFIIPEEDKPRTFEIPLPNDFEKYLNRLRSDKLLT